jgi:site-specific DNA recombinase
MLQNPIYRGQIVHKQQSYPGEHEPIIDPVLWESVQAKLAANAVERHNGVGVRNPSPLAGLLFDGNGDRMTPTHAVKNGTRYRYYVSQPLITGTRMRSPSGLRIPASNIEQLVADRIRDLLSEPDKIIAVAAAQQWGATHQQQLVDRAIGFSASWSTLSPVQVRTFLTTLIERIEVHSDRVDTHIHRARLTTALGLAASSMPSGSHPDEAILTVSVAAQIRRAGKELTLCSQPAEALPARPNLSLIKLIVRAHLFKTTLLQHGAHSKFADLARHEKLNRSYYSRVLRLAYLAPDITTAILDGRQPSGLTAAMLVDNPNLPLAWPEQRKALGFA